MPSTTLKGKGLESVLLGEVLMTSLILLVCLAASPAVCREEYPPVEVDSGVACLVEGQMIAAEWLEEHPKWTLKGWRCKFGPREKAA